MKLMGKDKSINLLKKALDFLQYAIVSNYDK